MCGFQRRFDASYMEVLKQVRSGVTGHPQSIHIVFRDHPTPNIEFLKNGGYVGGSQFWECNNSSFW